MTFAVLPECEYLKPFNSRTPEGVEDISKLPVLFAALLENEDVEWTDEDLAKLASKNLCHDEYA